MNSNIIIQQALELGFDFDQFEKTATMQDVGETLVEFFKDNADKLPQVEAEAEVHGHGSGQYVEHGNYRCSGQIVNFEEYWHKPVGFKVFHSNYVFLDSDGLHKQMNLYFKVEETESNAGLTYDVVFNDDKNSSNKGFEYDYANCYDYIKIWNGSDHSYFGDYKGGSVSIVCNETGEEVYSEEVY